MDDTVSLEDVVDVDNCRDFWFLDLKDAPDDRDEDVDVDSLPALWPMSSISAALIPASDFVAFGFPDLRGSGRWTTFSC